MTRAAVPPGIGWHLAPGLTLAVLVLQGVGPLDDAFAATSARKRVRRAAGAPAPGAIGEHERDF